MASAMLDGQIPVRHFGRSAARAVPAADGGPTTVAQQAPRPVNSVHGPIPASLGPVLLCARLAESHISTPEHSMPGRNSLNTQMGL